MRLPSVEEIRKFSLLEDIYDATRSIESTFVSPYNSLRNIPPLEIDNWVDEMVEDGMLHKADDMTLKVGVTYQGKQWLQNGFCKRQNLTEVKHAAKKRLLRWTYANDPHSNGIHPELTHEYLWFYGRELNVSDLERAARDMFQHGLLFVEWVGDDHQMMVRITDSGRDCVELFDGDIEAYFRSKRDSNGSACHTGSHKIISMPSLVS